jgi:N6-adenosine-specific RNA methylase IME4
MCAETRYRTIVADPPWQITMKMGAGGRRARATEVPYSMLSIDEIKALPVADLAADEAHLWLWATRRLFREGEAAAVVRAWGFEPVGEIIWGLRNPGMGGTAPASRARSRRCSTRTPPSSSATRSPNGAATPLSVRSAGSRRS